MIDGESSRIDDVVRLLYTAGAVAETDVGEDLLEWLAELATRAPERFEALAVEWTAVLEGEVAALPEDATLRPGLHQAILRLVRDHKPPDEAS